MRVGSVKRLDCPSCHMSFSQFIKVEDLEKEITCPTCDTPMTPSENSPKTTWRPFTPYYNKQLDREFHTADEERSYTKKHGLADITGEHSAWRSGRGGWKNKAG